MKIKKQRFDLRHLAPVDSFLHENVDARILPMRLRVPPADPGTVDSDVMRSFALSSVCAVPMLEPREVNLR